MPPSERIVVGGIGLRNRGMHDSAGCSATRTSTVAICDLQKKQQLAVKAFIDEHYGTNDCATYSEINSFLERGRTSTPC